MIGLLISFWTWCRSWLAGEPVDDCPLSPEEQERRLNKFGPTVARLKRRPIRLMADGTLPRWARRCFALLHDLTDDVCPDMPEVIEAFRVETIAAAVVPAMPTTAIAALIMVDDQRAQIRASKAYDATTGPPPLAQKTFSPVASGAETRPEAADCLKDDCHPQGNPPRVILHPVFSGDGVVRSKRERRQALDRMADAFSANSKTLAESDLVAAADYWREAAFGFDTS